jgi:hypothetical protein
MAIPLLAEAVHDGLTCLNARRSVPAWHLTAPGPEAATL